MAALTVDAYLDTLRRSGLIEPDQLDALLSEMEQQHHGLPGDPLVVAQLLVDRELVTAWQNRMLLRGFRKGYFLGKYKLMAEVGAGGMSSVYLAEHSLLRRRVAVKVLHLQRASNRSHLVRFYRESRITAALDHPNIVRCHDFDTDGRFHYLVMEYVDGPSLQALLDSHGPFEYGLAADYMAQAADGLAFAHQVGLIHRDVKPANLLVNSKGVLKVTDLGLTRVPDKNQTSLTVDDGSVLGTVDYLAPEQALDSHDVDARADIYSLGCTFYFLLTGRPPFPEGTMTVRLMRHQSEPPPDIRGFRPDAPQELIDACNHMLAKHADERPTATEVRDRLQAWLRSEDGSRDEFGSSDDLLIPRLETAGAHDTLADNQPNPPSTVMGSPKSGTKTTFQFDHSHDTPSDDSSSEHYVDPSRYADDEYTTPEHSPQADPYSMPSSGSPPSAIDSDSRSAESSSSLNDGDSDSVLP